MPDSFVKADNSLLTDPEISNTEKIVYLLLKSHCIQSNKTFVSQDTIASMGNMSRRTVIRAMKNLKTRGLISTKSRGKHKTLLVTLNPVSEIYDVTKCHTPLCQNVTSGSDNLSHISRLREIDKDKENTRYTSSYIHFQEKIDKNEIHKLVTEAEEKGSFARLKKKKRKEERKSKQRTIVRGDETGGELTPKDVRRRYEELYEDHYGKLPSGETPKLRGMLKNMIKKYGAQTVIDCFEVAFEKHQYFNHDKGVKGLDYFECLKRMSTFYEYIVDDQKYQEAKNKPKKSRSMRERVNDSIKKVQCT